MGIPLRYQPLASIKPYVQQEPPLSLAKAGGIKTSCMILIRQLRQKEKKRKKKVFYKKFHIRKVAEFFFTMGSNYYCILLVYEVTYVTYL